MAPDADGAPVAGAVAPVVPTEPSPAAGSPAVVVVATSLERLRGGFPDPSASWADPSAELEEVEEEGAAEEDASADPSWESRSEAARLRMARISIELAPTDDPEGPPEVGVVGVVVVVVVEEEEEPGVVPMVAARFPRPTPEAAPVPRVAAAAAAAATAAAEPDTGLAEVVRRAPPPPRVAEADAPRATAPRPAPVLAAVPVLLGADGAPCPAEEGAAAEDAGAC